MKGLDEFLEGALLCGKCSLCRVNFANGLDESCPSGRKFGYESYYASGRMEVARGLITGRLEYDERVRHILYTCTTCGYCKSIHHEIKDTRDRREVEDPVEMIEAMRAQAVARGGGPLEEHNALLSSIKNYGNPWQGPRAQRDRWSKGLDVRDATRESAELLFFVGCTSAYDPDRQRAARATARLLGASGLDFCTLGREEACCGSTVLRVGEREVFSGLAGENVEKMRRSGAGLVVTACAGCYKTLRFDYPKVVDMSGIYVMHVAELLAILIEDGRLSPGRPVERIATYHDPCHLGRCGEVYLPPRDVLGAIPGLRTREMGLWGRWASCCGAGGGVRTAYPDWATEMAAERVSQAEATGADTLVSACPFCEQNLEVGAKAGGSKIEVMDLSEVLLLSLEGAG